MVSMQGARELFFVKILLQMSNYLEKQLPQGQSLFLYYHFTTVTPFITIAWLSGFTFKGVRNHVRHANVTLQIRSTMLISQRFHWI